MCQLLSIENPPKFSFLPYKSEEGMVEFYMFIHHYQSKDEFDFLTLLFCCIKVTYLCAVLV